MPVCPSCNTEIDPTANYCPNCGEPIKDEPSASGLPSDGDRGSEAAAEDHLTRRSPRCHTSSNESRVGAEVNWLLSSLQFST